MTARTSFWNETVVYASRIKEFKREDWRYYIAWVGLMLGLFFSVTGFVVAGYMGGVAWPVYVWQVPIGITIFIGAIAFDTIGHQTVYKAALRKGEDLVHQITIACGITSVVCLVYGYANRDAMLIPALVLTLLSFMYSIIDEALHWHRYLNEKSDRVEMWSHFFIFLGHFIMMFSWWLWFYNGYPGVAETLKYLGYAD